MSLSLSLGEKQAKKTLNEQTWDFAKKIPWAPNMSRVSRIHFCFLSKALDVCDFNIILFQFSVVTSFSSIMFPRHVNFSDPMCFLALIYQLFLGKRKDVAKDRFVLPSSFLSTCMYTKSFETEGSTGKECFRSDLLAGGSARHSLSTSVGPHESLVVAL